MTDEQEFGSTDAPLDDASQPTQVVEDTPATPAAPTVPSVDFAALYRESLAERQRLAQEAEQYRNQLQQRNAPPEEEITDADIERYGTTGTIRKIVENTIAKQLREQLADIGEISQDFKRNKQLANAENHFFQQFPELQGVRDGVSSVVRQALQNAPSIDPTTYSQTALAAIGLYNIQNMRNQTAQPSAPAPASVPSPSVPASRGKSPVPAAPSIRLSELERSAMRKYGYDPNKADDVEKFMAIVNNTEGVTV